MIPNTASVGRFVAALGLLAASLGACGKAPQRDAPAMAIDPATGTAGAHAPAEPPPSEGTAGTGGPPPSAGAVAAEPPAMPTAGSGTADAGPAVDPPDAAASDSGAEPSSDERAFLPHASWSCSMPEGLQVPEGGALVLSIDAELSAVLDVGATQYGRRQLGEVSGGSFSSMGMSGTLNSGGLDYQLTLDNGVVEVEQVLLLQAGSEWIYLRTCGMAPAASDTVRIVPDFEARTAGPFADLNTGRFLGTRTLSADGKTLSMRIYDVSGLPPVDSASALRIEKPDGVPSQPWECITAQGTQGAVRFTERVEISGIVRVGESKRGTRTAIPITGGSVMGEVQGRVRAGGADFQLSANDLFLDARYTLETADGDLILVRNCGPASALVPHFETRVDGAHAWLNDNRLLSSSPGISIGAVNITIYDAD